MEPGTFKDRLLMEQVPHQLVEAVMIAGYAIQATAGYIFLRGEYVTSEKRFERSAGCRARGRLRRRERAGQSVEFRHPCPHPGAGRYICGEETALINSLRGVRARRAPSRRYPADCRRVGTPDHRQQRRDAVQPAAHRCERRRLVQGLSEGKSQDSGTKMYGCSGRAPGPA